MATTSIFFRLLFLIPLVFGWGMLSRLIYRDQRKPFAAFLLTAAAMTIPSLFMFLVEILLALGLGM